MLSVKRGQVVRVIQVTAGEWWYLEDRHGSRGYVPYTYLKPYPAGSTEETQGAADGENEAGSQAAASAGENGGAEQKPRDNGN